MGCFRSYAKTHIVSATFSPVSPLYTEILRTILILNSNKQAITPVFMLATGTPSLLPLKFSTNSDLCIPMG